MPILQRTNPLFGAASVLALLVSFALLPEATQAAESRADGTSANVDAPRERRQPNESDRRFRPRFSGFINAGVSHDADETGYSAQDGDTDFELNSLVGLQGRFELGESTSVTVQGVARGVDEWEPEIEWAMLSHGFGNGLTVRAGRLRVPLFMYSDYLEVGYAQPWARPPQEVYGMVPISSFNGIDAIHEHSLAGGTMTTQVFAGATEDEYRFASDIEVDYELENLFGGSLAWTDDRLTLRLNAARADVGMQERDFRPPLDVDDSGWFAGVGARWETSDWFVVGELTRIQVDSPQYPDTDAGYVSAGYRVGPTVPYVTLAAVESTDDETRAGTPMQVFDMERRAMTLGVRWDAMPRVAIKAEVTYADGLSGTWGGLGGNLHSIMESGRFAHDDAPIGTLSVHAVF